MIVKNINGAIQVLVSRCGREMACSIPIEDPENRVMFSSSAGCNPLEGFFGGIDAILSSKKGSVQLSKNQSRVATVVGPMIASTISQLNSGIDCVSLPFPDMREVAFQMCLEHKSLSLVLRYEELVIKQFVQSQEYVAFSMVLEYMASRLGVKCGNALVLCDSVEWGFDFSQGEDPKFSNLYEDANADPIPMISLPPGRWDRELVTAVSSTTSQPTDLFLSDVLIPMMNVRLMLQQSKVTGNYAVVEQEAAQIASPDWSIAVAAYIREVKAQW